MGWLLLIPVVLVVVGVIAYFAHQQSKQRREALEAFAARMGFTFDPQHDKDHDERYRHFSVFRKGHSRAAFNTMRGETEINGAMHPLVMGDFRYKITTSNGKTTTTHTYRLSYLIVKFPYAGVPDLMIRPEGVFDKIGQAMGFDDIDFEDAEFSRKFVVKSDDRRFAYDVCHPRMIEFLKEQVMRGPAIAMENGQLLLARDKRRWSVEEFEKQMWLAREFVDRWPDFVLADLGMAPGAREVDA